MEPGLSNNTFQFHFFDHDHMYERAKAVTQDGFQRNLYDPLLEEILVWGLDLQDTSHCPRLEYDSLDPCVGTTRWDRDFTLNDEEAQMSLLVS